MKTLNRCSLAKGQEIVIDDPVRANDLRPGDRLTVVGFEDLLEEVSKNFKYQNEYYWKGEFVHTRLYLAKKSGHYYIVWPEETVNGQHHVVVF
ncbi:hypothetical protein ACLVWU_06785 [Bdellovibrio sp. HCB290]|uniref:hypothetical protein n=1 Tax=Bdellovibrio sp. HCB290 TaxID=3394356 RepID=UPI0039B688B4